MLFRSSVSVGSSANVIKYCASAAKPRRSCTLNTRSYRATTTRDPSEGSRRTLLHDSESFSVKAEATATNRFYELTDLCAESADHLCALRVALVSTHGDNQRVDLFAQLAERLGGLCSYAKHQMSKSVSTFYSTTTKRTKTTPTTEPVIVERVEFVVGRLAEQLVQLIDYLLTAGDEPQTRLVDMVCTALAIYIALFHFSVAFLLTVASNSNTTNNANEAQPFVTQRNKNSTGGNSSSSSSSSSQTLATKLIRLKRDFFSLLALVIRSLTFSLSSDDSKFPSTDHSSSGSHQPQIHLPVVGRSTSSSSSSRTWSFSSYATLKILNAVLECFNSLAYLPNMYRVMNATNASNFYTGLVDNMHNVLNKSSPIDELEFVEKNGDVIMSEYTINHLFFFLILYSMFKGVSKK